jgi:hypothetical protein
MSSPEELAREKTYTAVNFVYRLIKLAGTRRVLFLVDRGNLGDQTLKEFQQFVTPDDGRKFTELYNVQHLQSAQLDRVSRVCISTIQRLYSVLHSLFFRIETPMPQAQITRGDRRRFVRIQRSVFNVGDRTATRRWLQQITVSLRRWQSLPYAAY